MAASRLARLGGSSLTGFTRRRNGHLMFTRCEQSASAGVPYEPYKADTNSLTMEAPSSADVVIVGGGVIGCATQYYLAKQGMTNTVLVERDLLTSGTTWHTAGLVWNLRPSDVEVQINGESVRLMKSLEEETGIHPGWINNGGLFIASTKERLDEYKRLYTLGQVFDVESHVLSPADTHKLYPLMNVKDVYGTLYSPSDGTIDPAGYCNAMSRSSTRSGARILQKCSVTGIDVGTPENGRGKVEAVHTDRGTIKTNCVVNCAGVWSPRIGAMAGVKVPLLALKHAYIVTERINGIQNMPNVRDHDASVYLKLQGDTLQIGGYEPNPVFWEQVQDDFAFSLFELDWDVFSVHIEGAINRVPTIEHIGIRSTVCGPESFTPDHKPLLGESPEVRGFFLGCGFNSSGMMLSGGCGRQLAHWILQGRPEWDMYGYDIRRFTTKLTGNTHWLNERSHESYADNYSIIFPHDEPLAARNLRKDVLHDALLQAGCVFQERQGWERPGWFASDGSNNELKKYDYYGSYGNEANADYTYRDNLEKDYTFEFAPHHDVIGKECLGCREGVAVFNMSYFGKYYLSGHDAPKAADWIFTNNMRKAPGATMYTCMLNKYGGTELDLTVSVVEPGAGGPHSPKFEGGQGYYLAVGGGVAQHAWSYIQDVLEERQFDCRLQDHSEDMCLISVQGPKSRILLQALTDTDLSDGQFPFSTHKVISLTGHECRALRLSFVGELGWELHVPNKSAPAVYEAIMKAGQMHNVVNGGYRALDSLSLEKGYRLWRADLRSDDSPLESRLGFTCKLKSDVDFLGRRALEEQKARGLMKKIACFTVDSHIPLHGLESIWRNDKIVGFIRRADFGFAVGKSIACGYITHPDGNVVTDEYLKSGSYQLEKMGEKFSATIHLKSPFDPSNKRVKGIYDKPLPIHSS